MPRIDLLSSVVFGFYPYVDLMALVSPKVHMRLVSSLKAFLSFNSRSMHLYWLKHNAHSEDIKTIERLSTPSCLQHTVCLIILWLSLRTSAASRDRTALG